MTLPVGRAAGYSLPHARESRPEPHPVIPRILSILLLALPASAIVADPLAGTKPLDEKQELHKKMVDGIHTYLDRETAASVAKRKDFWKPDFSTPEAYLKSIEPNRERLR